MPLGAQAFPGSWCYWVPGCCSYRKCLNPIGASSKQVSQALSSQRGQGRVMEERELKGGSDVNKGSSGLEEDYCQSAGRQLVRCSGRRS